MPLVQLPRFIYHLLYQPFAWSYDLVAWVVSLGHWKDWVRSIAPRLSGPRVLELGHGPGHLQAALAGRHTLVVGLDPSPQMGRLARRRLAAAGEPIRLVRAQAQHPPFATGSFDDIAATFPSEYILDPISLRAARRVLRPAGRLLVLPTAWLFSRNPPRAWSGAFARRLREAGFAVREELLKVRASRVMLVTASKPADET
ncbi:MAG: methyltransferase domain-containing protein [Anaerolineales bacterium]|nr:methyltransferase domain-containing protein [Anaerolineales bacterium]